jgi:hypothetical protein
LARDDREALDRHGRVARDLFRRLGCRLGGPRAEALLSDAKPMRRPRS